MASTGAASTAREPPSFVCDESITRYAVRSNTPHRRTTECSNLLGVSTFPPGCRCDDSAAGARGVIGHLADAVKSKRLPTNPAKGVENLPRKTGQRRVCLSANGVYRLADESGQHRMLVLVLAYTGIRWGEAVRLRIPDVEFLRRRFNVSENAVQRGVSHAVGPTKAAKPARSQRSC